MKVEMGKLPIKIWTEYVDLGDDTAIQQARNLTELPHARKWVALMPDYHLGYGMPIGGVLATKDAVVPNAVGVDIGCGMIARKTNLDGDKLTKEVLQEMRVAIHEMVPVGKSSRSEAYPVAPQLFDTMGEIATRLWDRAKMQIGTLGGGNHFIEIQRCVDDRSIWIMLHSGSRNVGKQIGDYYHKIAQRYMESFGVKLPDKDLAFLPNSVPEYHQYLNEMRWAMNYAEINRRAILSCVTTALSPWWGGWGSEEVETHHNFAALEHHYGENLLVHRKGAVRAKGLVTIPGSMGTASYIGKGLENPESFCSCSHGAGRRMGRRQAKETITAERARESMQHVVFGIRQGEYDEMPDAYKDIDEVMAAQADLVKPIYRLEPLAVVKG